MPRRHDAELATTPIARTAYPPGTEEVPARETPHMKNHFTIVGIGMMILSAALAGCTGNKDEPAPAPAPTTSSKAPAPPTTKAPAPVPEKPLPGLAYNKTSEYTMQSAPV